MVEFSYQMVLSTLQTAGLLIGIFYYVMTLRNQQKNQEISLRNQELSLKAQELAVETRQAQLFQSIYSRFQDENYVKMEQEIMSYEFTDLDNFNEKYGVEEWTKVNAVGRYYEGLGVHVSRNLIDVTMVDDLMSSIIIRVWEKAMPFAIEMRKSVPQWGEYAEYLYKQVKSIRDRQHPELAP